MRRSRLPLIGLTVAALTLVAVPGTAGAESPSPAWKKPGEGAKGKPTTVQVTGQSESLQDRREPLVLIGERREGRKRELTLNTDMLFAKDSADLNSSSKDTLDEVADRIEESEATGPVDIVGHTDTDGSTSYNQDLSTRRAKAVADALEPRLTGTDTELKPVGKGEKSLAVDPERSAADKAKNRRVTITYTTTKTEPTDDTSSTDISRPNTEAAEPAEGQQVEGSLGAYQRTLKNFDGEEGTIQVDVMQVKKQGPFVYVRMRTTAVSAGEYGVPVMPLFSGDTLVTDDASNTVLQDNEGGTKLRSYITGKGEAIRSGIPTELEEGQTSDVWFYFTAPTEDRETLDMYVPGVGVIEGLEV
ncbi:MAG: OmpA family protein [Streptosporangiales bacterium]|nr:OmpA family protein [Streptosporangiales bacterium]